MCGLQRKTLYKMWLCLTNVLGNTFIGLYLPVLDLKLAITLIQKNIYKKSFKPYNTNCLQHLEIFFNNSEHFVFYILNDF